MSLPSTAEETIRTTVRQFFEWMQGLPESVLLGISGVLVVIGLLVLLRRVGSLVRTSGRRVAGRVRVSPQRVLLTVLGVALAIGLMVSVTGIAVGLASQSVIQSENVDYWMVPAESSTESLVVQSSGVKIGNVHTKADTLNSDDRIDYATPVLITLVPLQDATGEREYVLTLGVVSKPDIEVLGLSADSLTRGDPYYADGTYSGRWTGEIIINEAAQTVLNTSVGETVNVPAANQPFTVQNVSVGQAPSVGGSVPIAMMHLSEAQSLAGTQSGDQADQILISTNADIRSSLSDQYPQTTVVTRSGLGAQSASTSSLPIAIALAALVTALVVGVLFVTTLMGLEVNASKQELGMLAAIGFSQRSRSIIVGCETIMLSLTGGLLGIGVGVIGIFGVNQFGLATLGIDTVARFDVRMLAYALVVAAIIGVIGSIYPILLSLRSTQLEVLSE